MGKQRPRGNEQWVYQLNRPGPDQEDALADLYGILVRGLGYALTKYAKVTGPDLHEFAYEALLKILAALHSFRGESRFITWALKIAVHTAFAELRGRHATMCLLKRGRTLPTRSPAGLLLRC